MWNITTNSLLIMISLSYDTNENRATRPVRQTDAQSFKPPQISSITPTVKPTVEPTRKVQKLRGRKNDNILTVDVGSTTRPSASSPASGSTTIPFFVWNPSRNHFRKHECELKKTTSIWLCKDILNQCLVNFNVTGLKLKSKMSWVIYKERPLHPLFMMSDCSEVFTGSRIRFGQYDESASPVKYPTIMPYGHEPMLYHIHQCSAKPQFTKRTCGSLIEECASGGMLSLFDWTKMTPYRINADRTVTELGHSDNCEDLFYGVPIHFAESGKIGMKVDVTIYARGEKRRSVQIDYTAASTPENIFLSEFPDRTDQRRVCAYAIQKDAGWDHFDQKKLYNLSRRNFRQLNIVEVRDNEKCRFKEL